MSKLTIELSGPTELILRRPLKATPDAVFEAHTNPALICQWMIGSPDWSMPVCISDPRPGGKIRYEWRHSTSPGFHLTGEYIEVQLPDRTLHVERMFLPDPTPDNRIETLFKPHQGGTLLVMRMQLPNEATRRAMLATGMTDGMELCYTLLDAMS